MKQKNTQSFYLYKWYWSDEKPAKRKVFLSFYSKKNKIIFYLWLAQYLQNSWAFFALLTNVAKRN